MSKVVYPVPTWEYNSMQRDLMLSDSTIETVVDEQGKLAGKFKVNTFVLCCGRASGKSYGVMRAMLKDAFVIAAYKAKYPERYRSCNPVVSVAIATPTAGHYDENWKVLTTLLNETAEHNGIDQRSLYGYRRADKKFWLLREGYIDIQFLSLYDSDSIRSSNIDILIVDEAAFIERDEEFWSAVKGNLHREATIPRIYACSSPNGKANLFYRLWKAAGGVEDCQYARNKAKIRFNQDGNAKSYHYTSFDNDRNSANFQEFLAEEQENKAAFNAERLAEFSESVHGERVLGDWSKYTIGEIDYKADDPVSIGFDVAMMGDDSSVITVIEPVHKAIVHIERGSKWDASDHIARVKDVVARYPNYRGIWIDATGPAGSWWKLLREEGLTVTPVFLDNKKKLQSFQTIKTQLDLEKIKVLDPYEGRYDNLPQGERLREEMKEFLREWEDVLITKHKAGYFQISHTGSKHDDIVMSWILGTYPWFSGQSHQARVQPGENIAKAVHRSILSSLI